MLALDTNVLIRAFVDDESDPSQCLAIRRRLSAEATVYVSQAVLLESVWTLASSFGLDKQQILTVLEHLRDSSRYLLQSPERTREAIEDYKNGTADFPDYLILAEARTAGYELLTLDKKLLKSKGTQRVK